jgi:hypothetical protein
MNLIMLKLNQVRLPARSREVVSPYLSPGMPLGKLFPLIYLQGCLGIDLFTEIPSLGRFTKNLEKGLEWASLNNPVRGGMPLLKFQGCSIGISNESTDEIPSEDPGSFTTVRLTKETRALPTLPLFPLSS